MPESSDIHPELPFDPDVPGPDRPVGPPGPGRRKKSQFNPLFIGLIFLGGAAGSVVRYAVSRALPTAMGRWPTATFVVNLVGALVLGTLLEALARSGGDDGWRLRCRLLIGTGFCGGLTTYSTFAVELDLLVRHGSASLALAYAVASLVGGAVCTAAGIALAAAHHRQQGHGRRGDQRHRSGRVVP
jgi:CrcB protein